MGMVAVVMIVVVVVMIVIVGVMIVIVIVVVMIVIVIVIVMVVIVVRVIVVRVVVRVRVVVIAVAPVTAGRDLDVDGGDAGLDDAAGAQALAVEADRDDGRLHDLDRHAEIEEGAQRHVAGDAAHAVDVQVQAAQLGHRAAHDDRPARRAQRTAATAAPKPLSMFTAVTPGAHDDSIEASATRPPALTP